MTEIKIVDVWAEWCAPCKRFAPIFEKIKNENPDIEFEKINADENLEFLQQWSIRGIPTIMAFLNNEPVFSQAGILSEPAFRDLVFRLRGLAENKRLL